MNNVKPDNSGNTNIVDCVNNLTKFLDENKKKMEEDAEKINNLVLTIIFRIMKREIQNRVLTN